MRQLLLLFALCVAPWLARAEQIHPLEFKYDICGFYSVLHINGVDTDRAGAQRNLAGLQTAYGNAHAGHQVRYGLAYNETRGIIMDVNQAYQQIAFAFPGITYGDWLGHVLNSVLPRWITDSVIGTIGGYLKSLLAWRRPDNYFDSDLSAMLAATYNYGFLNGGSRLTIVGHSHGTIYANIMYRYLTGTIGLAAYKIEKQQVALMSIAAFVPIIEGTNSLYVTNKNDNAVGAGRALYSDIKGGTVTIPNTTPWSIWRGHNLIDYYLKDPISKKQITDNMKTVMDKLQSARGTPGYTPPTLWAQYPFNTVQYMVCPPTGCVGAWPINGVRPGVQFTSSFYWWYLPNGGPPPNSDDARQGSRSDALLQSTANAKACYAATIAAVLPLKKAGVNQWPYLNGCWAFKPESYWWVYSGEGTPVWKSEYDIAPYSDTAHGYAAPTCKPVV